MAKLKTPEQKEKERDKRLQKTYGISASDYDSMLKDQDYECAICGGDGGERRLHVDHDHKHKQIKIVAKKSPWGLWNTEANYRTLKFLSCGPTKHKAIQAMRQLLKINSIRALICWPCNRTLRSGNDKPEVFKNMSEYLTKFNNGETPTT